MRQCKIQDSERLLKVLEMEIQNSKVSKTNFIDLKRLAFPLNKARIKDTLTSAVTTKML